MNEIIVGGLIGTIVGCLIGGVIVHFDLKWLWARYWRRNERRY